MPKQMSLFNSKIPLEYRPSVDKLKKLGNAKIIGFDIETKNDMTIIPDPLVRSFFTGSLGLSYLTEISYLSLWAEEMPLGIVFTEEDLANPTLMGALNVLFSNPKPLFVGHNLVFDLRLMKGVYNIPIPKRLWDTYTNEMLRGDADPSSSFMEGGGRSFSLAALVDFYQIEMNPKVRPLLDSLASELGLNVDAAYAHMKKSRKMLDNVPETLAARYAILDTYFTVEVMQKQFTYFLSIKEEYPNILQIINFEGRFNRACGKMCSTGMPVNQQYLRELQAAWDEEMQSIVKAMYQQTVDYIRDRLNEGEVDTRSLFWQEEVVEMSDLGVPIKKKVQRHISLESQLSWFQKNGFNPNRTRDKEFYFQEVLNIHPPKKTAPTAFLYTDSGAYSYSKYALEYYYERYGDVLELFMLFKRNEAKMKKAEELLMHSARDKKVHSLTTTNTVTGRTSSSQPNLQNMRMHSDKDRRTNFQGVLTNMPGYFIGGIDISNAETYMAAMMAKDSILMEALYQSDFHSQMAAAYFPSLWAEALTRAENGDTEFKKSIRSASKAITFGTAYGMGAVKLARHPDMQVALYPSEELLNEIMVSKEIHNWLVIRHVLPVDLHEDSLAFIKKNKTSLPQMMWEDAQLDGYELTYYITDDTQGLTYSVPAKLQANISQVEWIFAGKCWNANLILEEKERAFPSTTIAKEQAERFAERNGYVQMWTGRRIFVREARKAWNAICQGGVGELAKRWVVLVSEAFEEHAHLGAEIINFVHDEIIVSCPQGTAEIAVKLALNIMGKVIETQPLDNTGCHWLDRTTPRGRFIAGFDHAENSTKWGRTVYYDYPFDLSLNWEEGTSDKEVSALITQASTPEFQFEQFKKRRFYLEGHEKGYIGRNGLSLIEYRDALQQMYRSTMNVVYEQQLENLQRLWDSFRTALHLPKQSLFDYIGE